MLQVPSTKEERGHKPSFYQGLEEYWTVEKESSLNVFNGEGNILQAPFFVLKDTEEA